jgi:hypothetical protein
VSQSMLQAVGLEGEKVNRGQVLRDASTMLVLLPLPAAAAAICLTCAELAGAALREWPAEHSGC